MSKATEATDSLKAALEALKAIVNPISVHINNDNISVQVLGLRDMEQVPGDVIVRPWECAGYPQYTIEAHKMYEGVKFHCLLEDATIGELHAAAVAESA